MEPGRDQHAGLGLSLISAPVSQEVLNNRRLSTAQEPRENNGWDLCLISGRSGGEEFSLESV